MAGDAELAGGNSQGEGDDRSHDAVVEPTLDVEQPAKSHWHAGVVDHLRAERGVGGRQRCSDEAGQRPGQVVEEPGRSEGPEQYRERQPDPEQPSGQEGVMPELGDVHPRCVGEQQQGECHLREEVDRRSVDIDRQRTPVGVRQQEAGDQEDQRPVDVHPGQQVRDDGPPEDEEGNNGERFLGHPVRPPRSPVVDHGGAEHHVLHGSPGGADSTPQQPDREPHAEDRAQQRRRRPHPVTASSDDAQTHDVVAVRPAGDRPCGRHVDDECEQGRSHAHQGGGTRELEVTRGDQEQHAVEAGVRQEERPGDAQRVDSAGEQSSHEARPRALVGPGFAGDE